MKFKQLKVKYVAMPTHAQAPKSLKVYKVFPVTVALLLFSISEQQSVWSQVAAGRQSTSPLEILRDAPKVRLDDPEPTPRPFDPVPYEPQRGMAPPIQRVEPAFTPYSGATVGGAPVPQTNPYYPPAAQAPRYSAPTPTPRPVLGPEDVEKKPKKGFVRGLINAIPFVGGDDEDEDKTNQAIKTTPAPLVDDEPTPVSNSAPDIYRGYEAAPSRNESDGPLLYAPEATPLSGSSDTVPDPSSPPIMTPTPRNTPPVDSVTNLDDAVVPSNRTGSDTISEASGNAPLLTVKRETATTSPVAPEPPIGITKSPAVAPNEAEKTPVPLERATTSVLIQESRPSSGLLGPEPDSSATPLKSFDPTTTPAPDTSGVVTSEDDMATSLVIEQADLGMPNPTYEQNTAVLAEFQDAVRKARAEDHAGAAEAFRGYGLNHPSSGLAPRAYFLSIIFEKSRKQAKESLESMRQLFPESRYVKDAVARRSDLEAPATPAAEAAAAPAENPRQKVLRLEQELTAAVGDAEREPGLRKELGIAYLGLEEYDRAYEVLRPAAEMAAGKPVEGEILMALGRVLLARGETVQAISLYETVEQKFPALIYVDAPSAWSVGLAFEGVGRYSKAKGIYNTLRQRWPESVEAGWATTRLTDLASLQ